MIEFGQSGFVLIFNIDVRELKTAFKIKMYNLGKVITFNHINIL